MKTKRLKEKQNEKEDFVNAFETVITQVNYSHI